jgi:AAA+ superfamily predicted ATPase
MRQEFLMNAKPTLDELFERRITYPDVDPQARLARLVGLDEQKSRLAKILGLLVNPGGLVTWAKKHHPGAEALLDTVLRRPPLVVLAGDVGSGKTELAETIGDAVARHEKIDITLLPLSLSTRGQGRVGEMTQLISAAFDYTVAEATKLKSSSGKARGAVILLVDEADALAQSREAAQMHHEDRAGVNAFVRGIDRVANAKLPAAVIMCTNRLGALDPAVRRRAADVLSFARPGDEQRRFVLSSRLGPIGLGRHHIEALVTATGPRRGARDHGFTFSDLTQRLLPAIVLDAYPSKPVDGAHAVEIARAMVPTPPFRDGDATA